MKFETIIEHDKWMYVKLERLETYFTIESEDNTIDKDNVGSLYSLISCPTSEDPNEKGNWCQVEDLSEIEVGELMYMNILLQKLFRRKVLINQESLGQRGVSLTY